MLAQRPASCAPLSASYWLAYARSSYARSMAGWRRGAGSAKSWPVWPAKGTSRAAALGPPRLARDVLFERLRSTRSRRMPATRGRSTRGRWSNAQPAMRFGHWSMETLRRAIGLRRTSHDAKCQLTATLDVFVAAPATGTNLIPGPSESREIKKPRGHGSEADSQASRLGPCLTAGPRLLPGVSAQPYPTSTKLGWI